eukprot:SM000019S04980  [mRNA]  locus=s19:375693:376307:+ [translate_table: standard]
MRPHKLIRGPATAAEGGADAGTESHERRKRGGRRSTRKYMYSEARNAELASLRARNSILRQRISIKEGQKAELLQERRFADAAAADAAHEEAYLQLQANLSRVRDLEHKGVRHQRYMRRKYGGGPSKGGGGGTGGLLAPPPSKAEGTQGGPIDGQADVAMSDSHLQEGAGHALRKDGLDVTTTTPGGGQPNGATDGSIPDVGVC